MKLYKLIRCVVSLISFLVGTSVSSFAQSGDQVLDGIGETDLIARYRFEGDLKDWSRNTLHGKAGSSGLRFVTDSRFGTVLSMTGDSSAFVMLPSEALNELESISISGWINLRSKKAGQILFDFGKDAGKHFFTTPTGTSAANGYLSILVSDENQKLEAGSPALETGKWIHLTIVLDAAAKTLTTYADSKLVGEVKTIPTRSIDWLTQPGGNKKLYIGRSLTGTEGLDALLHDLRIYRVALSNRQIAGIFGNAKQGAAVVNTRGKKEDDVLPQFAATEAQLYNSYLTAVRDVKVETETGNLPRLPSYVSGTYKDGIKAQLVRVIWPAATDNTAVAKPGSYTVTGYVPGTSFQPKAVVTIKKSAKTAAPSLRLEPFRLDQVSLNIDASGHQTQFVENRNKFVNQLAKTDPNSFLYMFRNAFGQPQPEGAKPLGVWDSRDTKLRGHGTGHYLTAIAQAYAGTGYDKALQQNFARKMDYMVNTLYDLSQLSGKARNAGGKMVTDPTAVPTGPGKEDYDSDLSETGIRTDYQNWGKGFISAYPPDQFIMLEKGAKYGGQKNQIWAPYYTLHKILAGLLDVYEVSNNKKALDVASGMSDWVYARLSKVPTDTLIKMWNTYIAGEFGGMNEVMARLYRLTGKPDYLKTAQLFDNIRVFFGDMAHSHGLAKNVDLFRGLHANQHIPQVVGSIETYRVTNNPEYYKIADNFWYKAVNDYMYSIGGVAGSRNPANAECFTGQPGTLYENGFSSGGQNETCATYNMLKLTSDLFQYNQQAAYMDYYERALYNHILSSVAKETPANTYHVPLRPGSSKQFGNAEMTGFTCCNGTAIESSTKLQNSIYFKSKDNQTLYVNLFVPSTLDWTERKITLQQSTDFPKDDQTRVTVTGSGKFDLQVRVPGWATNGFFVSINGKAEKHQASPGSYLKISRIWKSGDVVDIRMPFSFHLDPVMDQQNIASLFYGPVLLAAQEAEPRKDWRQISLDATDISRSIKGDPKQLEFNIDDAVFKPFYQTYGRHSVYVDVKLK